MTISTAQRVLLRETLPDFGPTEEFVVDNRETFDALNAAASEYLRRRGDVDGLNAPTPSTELRGGLDQVNVLCELAQEMGFEVVRNYGSLFVRAPRRGFGVVVTVNEALRGRLGGGTQPL